MKRTSKGAGKRFGKGVFRIVEFMNPSGEVAFRVAGWTLDGKRIRENLPTHEEAVTRKQELEVQSANLETAGQTVFTRLSPEQVNEAEAAFAALARIGHGSLLGLVDFYNRNYRDPLKRISVQDAVDKFIAEKKSANRRERYLIDLRQELGYLKIKFGRKSVHELQKDDLAALIDKPGRGPQRQNNIRKDYRTFLNWCVDNGYAQNNPAELVPQKTVERAEIAALSVEKVKDLLDAAAAHKSGKLVPYVALGTFCAIRPDELARLAWDQIDLKERQVTITASAAKKRGRRVVDIPENCLAWLRPHAEKQKPIIGPNWRKDFAAVRAKIGYGVLSPKEKKENPDLKLQAWPQDVLRHTGISCHYRRHEDEGKTAAWAGNSPDMIHTHYRALVSAKDAAAFFEIVPDANGRVAKDKKKSVKGKIVAFDSVAASSPKEGGARTSKV